MFEAELIPAKSMITAKGDGAAVEIPTANTRVFLVNLDITDSVEQESFELSIYGSTDGVTWGAKALLRFPQKFYRGESPMLLDLSGEPDTKFVRAHWEVNRWGRGPETPMFQVGAKLTQVPAEILASMKK